MNKPNEFETYVKLIRAGLGGHYKSIAERLGVSQQTISDWNHRAEVVQAHHDAAAEAIKEMKKAGKDDWRMWDKVIDRAGMVVQQKTDLTTNQKDLPSPILAALDVHSDPSDV